MSCSTKPRRPRRTHEGVDPRPTFSAGKGPRRDHRDSTHWPHPSPFVRPSCSSWLRAASDSEEAVPPKDPHPFVIQLEATDKSNEAMLAYYHESKASYQP